MEKVAKKIKLNEFINMFNQLFLNVNRLINDLNSKKITLEIFSKGENDKFTNIDWSVQKMIENYLHHYYPGINFVGEENTSVEKVKPDFHEFLTKVEPILFTPVSEELTEESNNKYDVNDLCIYCDPIDSTSSFIKGNFEPVTVLVGVTYKGYPILGLIHFISFMKAEPASFFNIPGKGIFSLTVKDSSAENSKVDFTLKKEHINRVEKINFIITSSRENPTMGKSNFFIKIVIGLFPEPDTIKVSGLGNKAIRSILDDIIYFSPSKGLGYWDVCAGDALAREANGGCYYITGELILYPEVKEETTLPKVFCLTSSKKKAEIFLNKVKEANIII